MGRPTAQAQSAIDRLKTAGLKRHEFSVTTERRYVGRHPDTGKQSYEYGDLLIVLWSSKERTLDLANAMADQGFHVRLYQFHDGRMAHPDVLDVYWAKPGVWLQQAGVFDESDILLAETKLYPNSCNDKEKG